MAYLLSAFVFVFGVFLTLKPRYKVFTSLFVMTLCFSLVPRLVQGIDVWDVGAVMLLISGVQLMVANPTSPPMRGAYLTVLKAFMVWMLVCLVWSLVIYGYPILNTLKVARQMILGYLSIFILIRLFRVDRGAFDFLYRSFYWITYILLFVCLIQYVFKTPILFTLDREYAGIIRSLPIFLPFSLLCSWIIAAKLLSGGKVKFQEIVYLLLSAVVTATTFTRGVYMTVMAVFLLLLVTLAANRRLSVKALIPFSAAMVICLSIVTLWGGMDRVASRAASGFELVFSHGMGATAQSRNIDDTYSGRIALAQERFGLVLYKNPLVGYGFIHEDDVPPSLRKQLQHMHGSAVDTPSSRAMYAKGHPYIMALYSADIGWANIVLNTGIVGIVLFLAFLFFFVVDFWRKDFSGNSQYYHARVGLFLQTISLVLLMFNGTPFNASVQIPAFMIAGYAFCSSGKEAVLKSRKRSKAVRTIVAPPSRVAADS